MLLAYLNDYYNMVLLDIMMRVLLSLEVSNELCKKKSHIPIFSLTSVPFRDNKKELGLSGINHYISKPAKAKELQNLLKGYIKTAA
jgi:DNA-binding response OmpR family regulator